ncbi:CLUMA_CG007986, isoform A [Clunio marinus]|uniref:CLUMA_CG007986, isoform A n=1 Tax=Clunio marinus TaxID=568069 RepID=A0A1J1I2F2_9DIPT|nr:CLUMA_CG007986, isoform A [Clunio marinus]
MEKLIVDGSHHNESFDESKKNVRHIDAQAEQTAVLSYVARSDLVCFSFISFVKMKRDMIPIMEDTFKTNKRQLLVFEKGKFNEM